MPDASEAAARTLFDADGYLRRNPDVATLGLDPWEHYRTLGHREGRTPHPLFDPAVYRAAGAPTDVEPFGHYLHEGWRSRLRCSVLVDGPYYLARYADVREAGVDPWRHYVVHGWREGRQPNQLFSPRWYRARNPDVPRSVDPLLHYVVQGWREGRSPHPLFDVDHYLRLGVDVADARVEPLTHYLLHGRAEGRTPSDIVDPSWYERAYGAEDPLGEVLTGSALAGRYPSRKIATWRTAARRSDDREVTYR